MELRYFQIIVPLFVLLLVAHQANEYRKAKSTFFETLLVCFFWISIAVFALFPDFFSKWIAKIFGIKDNVNAIIFLAIGVLFYFQFQLYKILKRQDGNLTNLTRNIALDNRKMNDSETEK